MKVSGWAVICLVFYHGDAQDQREDALGSPGETGWLLLPHRDGSHQGTHLESGHAEFEVPAGLSRRAEQSAVG